MNIERILSNEQVQRWANDSLRDLLALSFSHYVAANIDWAKARFRTFVALGLPDIDILDFRTGGKISGIPRPDDWLIESIKCARGTEESFLFIEDWTARPNHSFIMDRSMPAVFSENEVYYVVKEANLEQLENWGRISSNTVPLFHGFVIHGTSAPSPGGILDKQRLEALAKHVQMIFFGAYDGESYLLCSFANDEQALPRLGVSKHSPHGNAR